MSESCLRDLFKNYCVTYIFQNTLNFCIDELFLSKHYIKFLVKYNFIEILPKSIDIFFLRNFSKSSVFIK